jgi:hypothetical protein
MRQVIQAEQDFNFTRVELKAQPFPVKARSNLNLLLLYLD